MTAGATRRSRVFGKASICVVTGCTSIQSVSFADLRANEPVTVQSGVAFTFQRTDGVACAMNRIVGQVVAVRGDTLHLRDLRSLSVRAGEPADCLRPEAGWLVVASGPELIAQVKDGSATASTAAAGFVVLLVILGLLG